MRCDEVMELMQRELDADLSADELRELDEHLHACTECQSLYANLKQLSLELENLPEVDPPVSIVEQILPQLAVKEIEAVGPIHDAKFQTKRAMHWKKWSVVAGGLAAAVCIWVLSEKTFAPEMKSSDYSMQKANEQSIIAKTPELTKREVAQEQMKDEPNEVDSIQESESIARVEKNVPKQALEKSNLAEQSLALVPKVEPRSKTESNPQLDSITGAKPSLTEENVQSKIDSKDIGSKSEEAHTLEPQTPTMPSIATAGDWSNPAAPSIASAPEDEVMMQAMIAPRTEMTKQGEPEQPIVSPSGKWSARVEENRIIVIDEVGLEVFRSHSWEDGIQAKLNWMDDTHLEYRLEPTGEKTKTVGEPEIWTVNLEERQEHKR